MKTSALFSPLSRGAAVRKAAVGIRAFTAIALAGWCMSSSAATFTVSGVVNAVEYYGSQVSFFLSGV